MKFPLCADAAVQGPRETEISSRLNERWKGALESCCSKQAYRWTRVRIESVGGGNIHLTSPGQTGPGKSSYPYQHITLLYPAPRSIKHAHMHADNSGSKVMQYGTGEIYGDCAIESSISVATRSKPWAVFACSNTWIVDSHLTQGMDVFVCVYSVFVVLSVGSGLATGWSLVQEVIPSV
jgi:hypothetical protein